MGLQVFPFTAVTALGNSQKRTCLLGSELCEAGDEVLP